MPKLLRDPLFLAWVILVAVTLVSVRIGGPDSAGGFVSVAAVTIAVLCIAYAKVAVVIFVFMEVRGAPLALRLLSAAWLAAVLAGLLAVYFGLLP